MPDDVPYLLNSVSRAEARASIAWRRECQIVAGFDPDEGPRYEKVWREIEAEKVARAKKWGRR